MFAVYLLEFPQWKKKSKSVRLSFKIDSPQLVLDVFKQDTRTD